MPTFPGLKICTPATPRDAKGLLKTAVRDNNPVLVLESELLYSSKGMVEPADHELLIPLGEAEVKREGSDVTIICYAQTVPLALAAAEQLGGRRNQRGSARSALDQAARLDGDLRVGLENASRCDCRTGPPVLWRGRGSLLIAFRRKFSMSSTRRSCAFRRKMCRCPTTNAGESCPAERGKVDRRCEESLLRLTSNRHA